MKQLITMTACLVLLMALLSQFVQNQRLLLQLEQAAQTIDLYCAQGKKERLKASLAQIMDCREEDILITTGRDTWKISVPLNEILAAPAFWGVDSEENRGSYQWERKISDE